MKHWFTTFILLIAVIASPLAQAGGIVGFLDLVESEEKPAKIVKPTTVESRHAQAVGLKRVEPAPPRGQAADVTPDDATEAGVCQCGL